MGWTLVTGANTAGCLQIPLAYCDDRIVAIDLANMVPKTFQAGYSGTTGFRKVVKATIYVKKKEGMSDEEFIGYYNLRHAQSAVPILQRHGIISYSLVILPAQ